MDETLKAEGAVSSQNVAPGDASIAGTAPLKIEAYVASEHTLRENISHASELADRLDALVIGKQPHDLLTIDTSALSIALRLIGERFDRELLPPAPGGDSFEQAMAKEQDRTKAWLSDLIDSFAPKLIDIARNIRSEANQPPLREVQVHRLDPEVRPWIETVVQEHIDAAEVRVFNKLKDFFKGTSGAAAATPPANLLAGDVVPAGAIQVGSHVKVWIDAAKKTFHTGVVREVHDGGHSFDVELAGGVGTHVQADSLALDELAQ